jgi:hypothetical protein
MRNQVFMTIEGRSVICQGKREKTGRRQGRDGKPEEGKTRKVTREETIGGPDRDDHRGRALPEGIPGSG